MKQDDYTSELIAKWQRTGYLNGVKEQDLVQVAQRLEAAYRRSMGRCGDFQAVNKEIEALRREGFYKLMNSMENRLTIKK
jgi:hypothetical protein